MTKSLARPTHSYLTNKVMHQFRDGQILDVYGKQVDLPQNKPVRDTLSLSAPEGGWRLLRETTLHLPSPPFRRGRSHSIPGLKTFWLPLAVEPKAIRLRLRRYF